ncbi:unnamed protein product [Schistosoma turkestanicum]|nr:unnamed protein product [Schistosoma turkestanicum]
MLASSVIVENIPLMPMTPQIVIEIPTNTPQESNYNSRTNLNCHLINGLFMQPNNNDNSNNNNNNPGWTSGTSSPGSCYQNFLTPYYWSIKHHQYLKSTPCENASSHVNLKEDYFCHKDKRNLCLNNHYQSTFSATSRRTPPPPGMFTSSLSSSPSSSSSPPPIQYSNQNCSSFCCSAMNTNNNQITTMKIYSTSTNDNRMIDFQRSSSTSLCLDNLTDNCACHQHQHRPAQQQQQQLQQHCPSERSSHIHRSCTIKSARTNVPNLSSNRSLSPYSCYNYPVQNMNLSKHCLPCLSVENQYSDSDVFHHSPNGNSSDSMFLPKGGMLTKSQKSTKRRRASSPISCQSLMNYTTNYPCHRSVLTKRLSTTMLQRSHSLPELSTIQKFNPTVKSYSHARKRKSAQHHDYWHKYQLNMKSCNFFYPTALQSNQNLFLHHPPPPMDLPCRQQIYLPTALHHRRHTEGCRHKKPSNTSLSLLLLQTSRRSNSVCSQYHSNSNIHHNARMHGNFVSSMRNVNYVNNINSSSSSMNRNNNENQSNSNELYKSNQSFLQATNQLTNEYHHRSTTTVQPSSTTVLINSNLDNNPLQIHSKAEHKQFSEINEAYSIHGNSLTLNEKIDTVPELHVKTSDSFTRCLCSLIVLLVCMQLFLGITSTALGLFLTWKVPELDFMECAYLSGIPLIISGLVGTCICFQHRIPSISPQFMNIIQVSSSILSLSCFIICLMTSIYTGQKGSLIASYDNTCRIISIEQPDQQQQQRHQVSSVNSKTPDNLLPQHPNHHLLTIMNHSNVINTHHFIEPCCFEIVKNTCECFTIHGERLAYYHNLPCRLLFSSIKDYIILQSSLMGVGSGVSLWSWLLFIENKFKHLLLRHNYARISFSSTRSSMPETPTGQCNNNNNLTNDNNERTNSLQSNETIINESISQD